MIHLVKIFNATSNLVHSLHNKIRFVLSIIDNNSFLHAPDQFKFKLLAEIAVE